ncbi:MAG TPA: ferredoxin [Trebonia sp.]|jgi:ferredoxin
MKIHVDPALCQGHNRCVALAPGLFDIDDEGYASAAGDGDVPPGQADLVELVIDNCPEQAITVVTGTGSAAS